MLGALMGSTVVLRRKFDPEECLRVTEAEGCQSMVVIPVMLQRIMALPAEVRDRYDLSGVEVVAASGSSLPGDLALEWMDQFGDNLYNMYGSTEVAYASIADPRDLREAPGSAGRPPYATVVKILDKDGSPVPDGEPGRIFVGNGMLFEGYTGGGHKEVVDGLMSSGDVGRIGPDGRLYVEGRDDEMIVSGGENVFPAEVEDCLSRHERVVEAAAIGIDDPDYGKRLRAFVVVGEPAPSEDDLKALGQAEPGAFQGAARDRLPRRAAPQRHRQGAQARAGGAPVVTGLSIGGPAPDFTLRDQFGQDVTLSSFVGSKAVLLVFYPYAFSSVCTGEMSQIRSRLDEFMTFGTEVLAISCDPMHSLRAFADADGLNFPLLSDFWPHGEVTQLLRRVRRVERTPAPVVVRRRQGGNGGLVGAQPDLPGT